MNWVLRTVAWFHHLAQQEHCDLCNQASVEMAKKVIAAIGEDHYLPCI